MEECTFKPKLYSNNLYQNRMRGKVVQDDNKNIYDRQNQWLSSVETKKEKKL